MTSLKFTEARADFFLVEGAMNFSEISKKTLKSCCFSAEREAVCVDLGKVTSVDSAGLALMIEWIKQCRQNNCEITFKNIPEQVFALAKLSGLDKNPYFDAADKDEEDSL